VSTLQRRQHPIAQRRRRSPLHGGMNIQNGVSFNANAVDLGEPRLLVNAQAASRPDRRINGVNNEDSPIDRWTSSCEKREGD